MSKQFCCKNFKRAREHKTDNEGYGALIWKEEEGYTMGCEDMIINFCPFCGQKLEFKEK